WWRLRWEPRPTSPSVQWRYAHSMAALGGGFAWPPLDIWSDGELVQLTLVGEQRTDAAGIRYIRAARSVEVPAADFEASVDRFLETTDARVREAVPDAKRLAGLRAELAEERADPRLAQQ